MRMEELVELYIESQKENWSETTIKNEQYRLAGVTKEMLTKPELLWNHFTKTRKLKPYSAKIAFVRAGEVLEFARRAGHMDVATNVLKDWISDNQKKFRNTYQKKELDVTFEEALSRIQRIEDAEVREKAEQLLATGMRYRESTTMNKRGEVVGKGSYERTVPRGRDLQVKFDRSYHTLLRHLKKVGLTPHMLRKLAATKAAEGGAQVADLMAMFGWKSHQMPAIYVQAQRTQKLADDLYSLVKGKKGGKK